MLRWTKAQGGVWGVGWGGTRAAQETGRLGGDSAIENFWLRNVLGAQGALRAQTPPFCWPCRVDTVEIQQGVGPFSVHAGSQYGGARPDAGVPTS